MADKKEIDFTYTFLDEIFRLSMGETGDFSGAMYNGDFSLSLEEAQQKKHAFIIQNLNITKGKRVLDMGCGWGALLNDIRKQGADGTGLTLSDGQAKACKKNGLNVFIKDCRKVKPQDFGVFDAVASIGAFEHFCSVKEWKEGKQDEVYSNFFKMVYDLLPSGGKFYLQTMVFGRNMKDHSEFDITADKNADEYILALMEKQFPESWLPYGLEQITKNSSPYFNMLFHSSGRLDYIETINQWRKKFRKFNLKKYLIYTSLIPKYIFDKNFRHWVDIFRISPNKVCFERELMDHYRIVFEKK